jgi:hypothetical protein
MKEIEDFCNQNSIIASKNNDSYYFTINGINYRVSNHTIEASNKAAFDIDTGMYKRDLYHETKRKDDTVYIHAGKTRIIDIYNNLKAGYELNGKGYRIKE